ncbi:type VI secretion system effector, Hcp1 family protein, partial [Vibrio cholerae HC-50A2]
CMYC